MKVTLIVRKVYVKLAVLDPMLPEIFPPFKVLYPYTEYRTELSSE